MTLGIDFGTKHLIAAWVGPDGAPMLVPDRHDPETFLTPAVVCLDGDRAHLGRVGEVFAEENPALAVARNLKTALAGATPVLPDQQDGWHAETFIALLLRKLADDAALATARRPERTTIAVPQSFNPAKRQALKRAADWAGFHQVELLDECVAAARYFFGQGNVTGPQLVLSVGASHVEAAVLEASPGQIRVLGAAAADGGAAEIDAALLALVVNLCGADAGSTGLLRGIERVKQQLTRGSGVEFEQVFFPRGRPRIVHLLPLHIGAALERPVGRLLAVADQALAAANLEWRALAGIWPIGQGATLPQLLEPLAARAGKPVSGRQPLQAAVFGAALHASDLAAGRPWSGMPRPPGRPGAAFGLRLPDREGKTRFDELIPANATRPAQAVKRFVTTRADQSRMVFDLAFVDGHGPEAAALLAFGPIVAPRLNLPIELHVSLGSHGEVGAEAVDVSSGNKLPRTVLTKGVSSEPLIRQRQLLDTLRFN